MDQLAEALDLLDRATAALPTTGETVVALPDDEVLDVTRRLAEARKRIDTSSAIFAGEIDHRSRPDLGYAGLAQRTGMRTAQNLVQNITGSSGRDAATLVRVGKVMHLHDSSVTGGASSPLLDAGPEPDADPQADHRADHQAEPGAGLGIGATDGVWLAAVADAIRSGALSVPAAEAIRRGLGTPNSMVTIEALATAAAQLVRQAPSLTVDQLAREARACRDDLDAEGIAAREAQRRDQRYVRYYRRDDGMTKIDALLDPESAAIVVGALDEATSPRRGGPRFVDETDVERSNRTVEDPRTTDQLTADTLVELIRIAGEADPGRVFGRRRPAVRVLVNDIDYRTRSGKGRIEGQPDPVSIQTVERQVCNTGALPIVFDEDGQVLNLGREQRLFTEKQRIALAARDGGCRFPGCHRPPSWCEAHHIDQWQRDGGRTDVADGMLLCRHHHMLIHNNHWKIRRSGGRYDLIPPRERDPGQRPIDMPTKSLALADLQRHRRIS